MSTTNPADASFWDDISQLLGKSAQGAGQGRAGQATYENARDALAARLYDIAQTSRGQAANSQLASDKFRESLPGIGASEAVRGALIQNAHNATFDPGSAAARIPQMHFAGIGPDSLTPEARAAGAALSAHGTSLLNNPGGALTAVPGSGVNGAGFLTPPTPSKELTPGFWEQAAGVGSIATGLTGALAKLAGSSDGSSLLKKLFGGGGGSSGPGGIDNSGNTEDTRTEDMRSGSSGVAYGPDGQPLPVGSGVDDAGGYYDPSSGQYIPADTTPDQQQPDDWYTEGIG